MRSKLTLHRIKIHTLQLLGNRPTLAFTNLTTVQFTDRQNFSGGAGEEGFFGDVHVVASDAAFFHHQAQVFGEVDDGGAGDAGQAGGQFRGVQLTVANDEDVLARAFRHVAFVVQQQGFFSAAGNGFVQDQHGVDVVTVGLRLAHGDVHVVAGV